MPRPLKQGLEYFPLDVDFLNDRKFRNSKQKFGYLAPLVYIALVSLIYKDKGYYIEYSDRTKADVLWDIQAFLQGKFCPDIQTLAEVVDTLAADGLFAADRFHEASILTSKRIQRTFYSATVERTGIKVDENIWDLTVEEMTALSRKSSILRQFVNRTENPVSRAENSINPTNNTQSKVKKSKGKESRVEKTAPPLAPADYEIAQGYGEDGRVILTRGQYAQLSYQYGLNNAELYISKMAWQIQYKDKRYGKPFEILNSWLVDDGVTVLHFEDFREELAEGETVQEFINRYFGADILDDFVPAPDYEEGDK